MSNLVVFDDSEFVAAGSFAPDLAPLTDLRAVFDLRTGSATTLERLERAAPVPLVAVFVPSVLEALTAVNAHVAVNVLPQGDRFLCVNGRFSYPAVQFNLAPGQALVEADSQHVIGAHLDRDDAIQFLTTGTLPDGVTAMTHEGQLLLRRPWEILAALPATLVLDLLEAPFERSAKPPAGVHVVGEAPIYIDPSATVGPGCVLDAENGPVVIGENAVIRPGCTLIGPVSIGERSIVLDRAVIKANTVIGPVCKVAGEVGGTIFQGFANKAHDGHLGDSFVGQWVNLGAGTVNSNLRNTYSPITIQQHIGAAPQHTGRRYLGTFFGDHVKTAIGTRLMTGTVLGTGSMIAASTPPPTCVAPFAWITDRGEQVYRIDEFIEVARTVMGRRDVHLSGAEELRLRELHKHASAT